MAYTSYSSVLSSSPLCMNLFLLSLLLFSACSSVHGGVAESFLQVDIPSLLPSSVCSSTKEHPASSKAGASLKVTHPHGPCSLAASVKEVPSHKQILDNDRARVEHIHSRQRAAAGPKFDLNGKLVEGTFSASEIPARSGLSLNNGNYVVTIGFGTPAVEQTVFFDTGSDVTWIQCKPCVVACYTQQEQLFDPTKSSTYANISCSSIYCTELNLRGCNSSTCLYGVQYADNSFTAGFFAQETLTLAPHDVLTNFRFGCGENNDGLFGRVAGLLGLGRRKVSLVSQSYMKYGGVFSYCLPSTSSSTGYLTFGSGPSNVQYTPMLSNVDRPTFYYLNLVGIKVGGVQLSVPATVFSHGGTIIDSGTVISRLPPTAYSALRSAFRQQMTQYKSAPALSILDTCYDLTGYTSVTIPTVALVFEGTTVNLDPSGILYVVRVSQACLAFAGNAADTNTSILGNVQQRKFNVVYDLSKQVIGFGAGGC